MKGFYQKAGKLLLLGLDNAGKTTLLGVLKEGHIIQPVPTLHPSKLDWELAMLMENDDILNTKVPWP